MQQHGNGHPHILGASCHYNVLPKSRNTWKTRILFRLFVLQIFNCMREDMVTPVTCAFDNFPDSPGSGRQHGGLIQAHATYIDYMEAIYVLGRGNCITDSALINVVCNEAKKRYSQFVILQVFCISQ